MQVSDKLIPGAALIYERDDKGVVYARYRDPPHNSIPRWIVGGPQDTVSYPLLGYGDWQEMIELAKKYPTLKKQLDNLLNVYYIIKEEESK